MPVLDQLTAVPKRVLDIHVQVSKTAGGAYLDVVQKAMETVTSYQQDAARRNGDRLSAVVGVQTKAARQVTDLYVKGGRKILELDVRGSRVAEAMRSAGSATEEVADQAAATTKGAAATTAKVTKRTVRQARKVPGVARAEGQL